MILRKELTFYRSDDRRPYIYGAKRMTRNGQCFSFQHGNVSALNAMIKFQTSLQFAIISYISLAKSLAGIQTNGNYPIERPVASQSYLAPQQTNKQEKEMLPMQALPSKKDSKS